MPEILSVKYRENSAVVELECGDRLIVSLETVIEAGISSGTVVTEEDEISLRARSQEYLCRQKALRHLSSANRSAGEMELYLRRKGFGPDAIEKALDFLKKYSYIDDEAYARDYIERSLRNRAVGRHRIRAGLLQKGVAREIIEGAISEAGEGMDDIEYGKGLELALKKLSSLAGKDNCGQKLYAFLSRRGFSAAVIRKIFRKLKIDMYGNGNGNS